MIIFFRFKHLSQLFNISPNLIALFFVTTVFNFLVFFWISRLNPFVDGAPVGTLVLVDSCWTELLQVDLRAPVVLVLMHRFLRCVHFGRPESISVFIVHVNVVHSLIKILGRLCHDCSLIKLVII